MIVTDFMQLLLVTLAVSTASARIPSSHLQTSTIIVPPCKSGFQWTFNQKNNSPCFLAATVMVSCAGTDWTIKPLTDGDSYDPPAGNNVTQCSCSWAAYNLLMACTVCQGVGQDVIPWPQYITNCTGQTSNIYFPSNQAFPNGTGIPYYASQNPTEWTEQRFDASQAEKLADQEHPDLFPSSPQPSHKSSSPVGAIVGGVIGGLAVFALAGGLAFWLYQRRQKRIQSSATHFDTDESKHARKMSDMSQKSGIGYGYQQIERSFATSPTSQPPLSPTTGTMHTHTASANSLSYFGSVRHSVNPYGTSTSPPPGTTTISSAMLSPSYQPNAQGLGREGIIVPFTLPPSDMTSFQGSSTNVSDRKRPDGAIIPVYDQPNSLPPNVTPALSETSTNRPRVNPPAYSDVASTQIHQKKDSNDTHFSTDSKTDSVVQKHSGDGSISTIEEVIGQMGLAGQESVSAGGTLSTGQSGQLPGARPFRPVLGNPDP